MGQVEDMADEGGREIQLAAPDIHVLVCLCSRFLGNVVDQEELRLQLGSDPAVGAMDFVDDLCTPEGMEKGMTLMKDSGCNRWVVGGMYCLY